MADFYTILSGLEGPSQDADPETRARLSQIGKAIVDSACESGSQKPAARREDYVAAAYAFFHSEGQGEQKEQQALDVAPVSPEDWEALRRELRKAKGSVERLRWLRRKIAWMCHPDRRNSTAAYAEALMAEFNAEIDEAIKAIRDSER